MTRVMNNFRFNMFNVSSAVVLVAFGPVCPLLKFLLLKSGLFKFIDLFDLEHNFTRYALNIDNKVKLTEILVQVLLYTVIPK